MGEDLFADYGAPLDAGEMRRLLRLLDAALADDSNDMPEQEVLRLWWGTADVDTGPLRAPVGALYGCLLDWQDGVVLFSEAQKDVQEQVRRLWKVLGPDEGCDV